MENNQNQVDFASLKREAEGITADPKWMNKTEKKEAYYLILRKINRELVSWIRRNGKDLELKYDNEMNRLEKQLINLQVFSLAIAGVIILTVIVTLNIQESVWADRLITFAWAGVILLSVPVILMILTVSRMAKLP